MELLLGWLKLSFWGTTTHLQCSCSEVCMCMVCVIGKTVFPFFWEFCLSSYLGRVSGWASEWGSELRWLVGKYVAVGGGQILTSDFWFAARTCSSCVLLLLSQLGPWAVPSSVYTSQGWPSLSLSVCLAGPQKNRTVLERNVVTFLIPVIICDYSEWDLSSELHI